VIQALLLDIEGTTSSLAFARDVLFPYAREHLGSFIQQHRGRPEVEAELSEASRLAEQENPHEDVHAALQRWMAQDRKVTPLKALQGLLWEAAFARGELVAHVYPEVPGALASLRQHGLRVAIYSSGSVRAQRAFFRYSAAGDLCALIDGWFDTSIGHKVGPSSYRAIARALALEPSAIAFLSDTEAELDAARAAGLTTLGILRAPLTIGAHAAAVSFDGLSRTLSLARATDPTPAPEKATVAALSRYCHARGWASATSGNFSVRAGERMAITASGVDKGRLSERDVLWVGLDGVALEPGRPSAEAPLHAQLYRSSPRIGAVLHTHSIAATVLSRRAASARSLALSGYEMAKALAPANAGGPPEIVVPIFANEQDTTRLAATIGEQLARAPALAYLVEGHGLTTWAADADRARHHTEALELMLACELAARG
jgi:2,3-diketo-5-methylthio-1-phosphopentane phosphatase/methylthioribulose-1-phosphate dehydratase